MSLELERRRGEQARRLLEEPLLVEAFAAVEGALRQQWETTEDAEEAVRERAWLMLKLLRRVRAGLAEVMETGRLSERQLAALEAAEIRPVSR